MKNFVVEDYEGAELEIEIFSHESQPGSALCVTAASDGVILERSQALKLIKWLQKWVDSLPVTKQESQ